MVTAFPSVSASRFAADRAAASWAPEKVKIALRYGSPTSGPWHGRIRAGLGERRGAVARDQDREEGQGGGEPPVHIRSYERGRLRFPTSARSPALAGAYGQRGSASPKVARSLPVDASSTWSCRVSVLA